MQTFLSVVMCNWGSSHVLYVKDFKNKFGWLGFFFVFFAPHEKSSFLGILTLTIGHPSTAAAHTFQNEK